MPAETVDPEFLTVPEIARRLNISRAMAYRYVENGEIPCVRIGRTIRVRSVVFDECVRQREG